MPEPGRGLRVRSLIDEAPRAELWRGGPFVNLGSLDQAKYIQGGWVNSWGLWDPDDPASVVDMGPGGSIFFHDWYGGIQAVQVRVESPSAGLSMGLSLDGKPLGRRPLEKHWNIIEFKLNAPTTPGRHTLQFLGVDGPRYSETGAPLRLDWVWFRGEADQAPAPGKVAALNFGAPMRALVADPPRTFSYYLRVPPRGVLRFAYGAYLPTTFKVGVALDGRAPRGLFEAVSTGGGWKQARVSLGALAGRLVRLDLVTLPAGPGTPVPATSKASAGWGEPVLALDHPDSQAQPPPVGKKAKNLILVVYCTARRDQYRAFSSASRVATPGMDMLARQGVVFDNAYANASFSLPSFVSLLTSRYPSSFSVGFHDIKIPSEVQSLPTHLGKHGFSTALLATNPYLTEPFGMKRGWDHFKSYILGHAQQPDAKLTDSRTVFEGGLRWLDEHGAGSKPFLLMLQTMDPHVPYRFRKGFTERYVERGYSGRFSRSFETRDLDEAVVASLTKAELQQVRGLYSGEVAFQDAQLERFLMQVSARGLDRTTLVVLVADHGEELHEHGMMGHGNNLREAVVRVPLILRLPGVLPAGRRVSHLVELVDLTPTLLELLGVPPLPGAHGVSLMDTVHDQMVAGARYVYMEDHGRAVRLGQYKLVAEPHEQWLYDLTSDPGEQQDRSRDLPVARRALEIYLSEALMIADKHQRLHVTTGSGVPTTEEAQIPDDLRKKLQALGYLQ